MMTNLGKAEQPASNSEHDLRPSLLPRSLERLSSIINSTTLNRKEMLPFTNNCLALKVGKGWNLSTLGSLFGQNVLLATAIFLQYGSREAKCKRAKQRQMGQKTRLCLDGFPLFIKLLYLLFHVTRGFPLTLSFLHTFCQMICFIYTWEVKIHGI